VTQEGNLTKNNLWWIDTPPVEHQWVLITRKGLVACSTQAIYREVRKSHRISAIGKIGLPCYFSCIYSLTYLCTQDPKGGGHREYSNRFLHTR